LSDLAQHCAPWGVGYILRPNSLVQDLIYPPWGRGEVLGVARSFEVEFGGCDDRAYLPDAALCIVGGVQVLESVVLVFDFAISAAEKTSHFIL
jgi:hypothetical protein